ncbi:MAG: methyltransferase domain-containing protein [Alphaproteobacteria bacterium]|nr:methyltransferase domain-containing protein [Alphaproteobacteria bacterium]
MTPLFSLSALRQNKIRAESRFCQYDFLHRRVLNEMLSRLDMVKRSFEHILMVGMPDLAPQIESKFDCPVTVLDLSPRSTVIGTPDYLPFGAGRFDLILCPLSLHILNDVPGAFWQLRQSLKPDGFFMTALMGGETLWELRTALSQADMEQGGGLARRLAPLISLQDISALMQRAQFTLPVVDHEKITVTYADPLKLIHDLRGMGEGNPFSPSARPKLSRTVWQHAQNVYRTQFSEDDGRIPATFDILYACGWQAHDSQQKPLRPGSAQKRLADALNTSEIGAGEKALP